MKFSRKKLKFSFEPSQVSWSGVPACLRSRVWKLLCGYLPAGGQADQVLKRKREEYTGYVNQYFNNKEEDIHKDTFRWGVHDFKGIFLQDFSFGGKFYFTVS